ncbi:MAG: MFS transporter [Spirochaetes bacterium]|nr:MFS transporter [Spirochaetota bacterium]
MQEANNLTTYSDESPGSKISIKETLSFAMGNGFAMFLAQMGAIMFLTIFWTDVVLIPAAIVGTIFLFSRIFDGFTDVLAGAIIHKTKTRMGKARPWLLWMALPSAFTVSILFYAPDFSLAGKIAYAAITYNLFAFFYLTMGGIAILSSVSLITQNQAERSKLVMVAMIFSAIASIVISAATYKGIEVFGGGSRGYFLFFTIIGIITGLGILIQFLGTKERAFASAGKTCDSIPWTTGMKHLIKNKYWWIANGITFFNLLFVGFMAINIFFVVYVLKRQDMVGPVMGLQYVGLIVGSIVLMPVVKKIGKRKGLMLSTTIQIIASIIMFIEPTSLPLILIGIFIRGFGSISIGLQQSFLADTVEYGEWKCGARTEGLCFSSASFCMKVATGLGGAMVGWMLAWGGYVPNAAQQSSKALSAITFMFIGSLAVLAIVQFILAYFFKLDNEYNDILRDLKNRREKATP